MTEATFACPNCAQHISCDESYRGHQVQCPTCQTDVVVPQLVVPPSLASAAPAAPASENSESSRGLGASKVPIGAAALGLTVFGRLLVPIFGDTFGPFRDTFGTFLGICSGLSILVGFILAIVSIVKRDGWLLGFAAVVVNLVMTLSPLK